MDTLKQLAYKTLNMLKLFLIDNFTEKRLHFTPKLSKNVNEKLHQLASSKICEQPPREYGEAFSKLLSLNVTKKHTCQHFPSFHLSHLSTLPQ